MFPKSLLIQLKNVSQSYGSRIHGVKHWRAVERNGLYLARFSGADTLVVSHFAYFHDCMRQNDGRDPDHGPRAASYALSVREQLSLDNNQMRLLIKACEGHTSQKFSPDPTIGTCWDADRLDLGRVWITPRSEYLSTAEAKRIADENDFNVIA